MLNRHFFFLSYMASIFYNVLYIYLALNLHENQNRILDQYIMQINSDITLRHKIEHINLLLTNQSLASPNANMPASLSSFNLHTDTQDGSMDDGSVFNESLDKKKEAKFTSSHESTSSPIMDQFNSPLQNSSHANINYDNIEMLLIDLKKYIVSCVFHWNTKMSEFFKKTKFSDEITGPESSLTNPIEIPKYSKQGSQFVSKEDESYYGT